MPSVFQRYRPMTEELQAIAPDRSRKVTVSPRMRNTPMTASCPARLIRTVSASNAMASGPAVNVPERAGCWASPDAGKASAMSRAKRRRMVVAGREAKKTTPPRPWRCETVLRQE